MKIETLRWAHDKLEMIDQRILPAAFEYVSYDSAASVADGIRSMVVRGAPAIGVAAAYGVALEALRLSNILLDSRLRGNDGVENFNAGMEAGFSVLSQSRPTAVNLFWALQRMRKIWEGVAVQTPQQIAEALLAEAHEILAEDIRINRAMGAFGAELLADGARVLTHCNAGALATAGWGTALGVFRSAVEAGKKISVIADETRPFLQGARLTAWELMEDGAGKNSRYADYRQHGGLHDGARRSGCGGGWHRSRGGKRRCGEQDRHLHGGRAGAAAQYSVLCGLPAVHY